MVSGIFNNSRTKGVTAQNIASASRSGRQESFKENFRTKTILESYISSIFPSPEFVETSPRRRQFQLPDTGELAASGGGQQPPW
jgi:hypothetical protein